MTECANRPTTSLDETHCDFLSAMNVRFECRMLYSKFTRQSTSSLVHHIIHVVLVVSYFQMLWIAASSVSNARMKNIHSIWYILSVFYNPSQSMRMSNNVFSLVTKPEKTIPVIAQSRLPGPAAGHVFASNLAPKSPLHFWGKDLLHQSSWNNLWLHRSVCLICVTLSAVCAARGLLYGSI